MNEDFLDTLFTVSCSATMDERNETHENQPGTKRIRTKLLPTGRVSRIRIETIIALALIHLYTYRIIQMGRVPFVLYDDILWQPYEGTEYDVSTYAYVASTMANKSSNYVDVIYQIANASDAEYLHKLAGVKRVRRAFTYQGVFEEIEAFLRDPFGPQGGHLRCAVHPRTMLCCG